MSCEDSLDRYKIQKGKGLAVVCHNESNRPGDEKDFKNLKSLLSNDLKFKLQEKKDFSRKELARTLQTISKNEGSILDNTDCLLLFIMAHGNEDGICDIKERPFPINDIYDFFNRDNCPALQGKPKIFIIQSCRGQQKDKVQNDFVTTPQGVVLPHKSDMLIAFATAPDFNAKRDTEEGTWFISTLVKVFKNNWERMSLCQMLTLTNALVAEKISGNGEKQSSYYVSYLRKELYFSENPTVAIAKGDMQSRSANKTSKLAFSDDSDDDEDVPVAAKAPSKPLNKENLSIMLIGLAGHGKSATGNTLLGAEELKRLKFPPFTVGSGGENRSRTTRTVEAHKVTLPDKTVTIIDTPGLECRIGRRVDENEYSSAFKATMRDTYRHCPDGIDLFLLVLPYDNVNGVGRYHPIIVDTIKMFIKQYKGEEMSKRCSVAFTYRGAFVASQQNLSFAHKEDIYDVFDEWWQKNGGPASDIITTVGHRFFLIDNTLIDENDEERSKIFENALKNKKSFGSFKKADFVNIAPRLDLLEPRQKSTCVVS